MNEINNLSNLFEIYENRKPKYIIYFRGQFQDWPLRPSLARDNVSEQERSKESKCFERLAMILPNKNDWECATIAQHYGVPTRLIDWSENPLVGLYFAVNDVDFDNKNGVIWVFESKSAVAPNVASLRNGSGLRNLKYPRPYRAWKDLKLDIPRTKAQRGVLTSQPNLEIDFDKQNFNQETQSLNKYVIPKKHKSRLRNELAVLGITEKTLFPDFLDIGNKRPTDLVGICMQIRCDLFKL